MSDPIRVVLVDDHPGLRAGIRAMLEATGKIRVVGEAGDGDGALRVVRADRPDVVVLDMEIPPPTGAEVAQIVSEEGVTKVLAYSAYDDYSYVVKLLQAGAAGYITKDKPLPLLVEAVEAVARGERRWFVDVQPPEALAELSERESEVLQILALGGSNDEIGDRLHLSPHTVRNYVSSIYGKLGVKSWREAVAWAWQHGVVRA